MHNRHAVEVTPYARLAQADVLTEQASGEATTHQRGAGVIDLEVDGAPDLGVLAGALVDLTEASANRAARPFTAEQVEDDVAPSGWRCGEVTAADNR